MGLFARFTCLRRQETAGEFAQFVRDLLRSRDVVETADPSAAERLLMIAPAGEGWLMVVDHAENLSEALSDEDGLLMELTHAHGMTALDIFVADSDQLMLCLTDGHQLQAQLAVGHQGIEDGALEPWERLLVPGQSIEEIRKTFSEPQTFIEQHFPALKQLFGIDLGAFWDAPGMLNGQPVRADAVLLRLKRVSAPGQTIGPPRLEVDEVQRQNFIRNHSYPKIPLGLIANFPAFCFQSRGACARGLEARLTGTALDHGLIEIVSAKLFQRHPVESNLNREVSAAPEVNAGVLLRFPDIEVPDYAEPAPTARHAISASRRSPLHDLLVFVYCRALKAGEGQLEAEACFVSPKSEPVKCSYPVLVLPEMWRPLRSSDAPYMLHAVRQLNDPARINALAVLRGGVNEAVSALQRTLETWRQVAGPASAFSVAAATGVIRDFAFYWPADLEMPFDLDLNKKKQAKWDRLMANLQTLQGLRITSGFTVGSAEERSDAARIVLHYISPAAHPQLPEYAARLGHVSLSAPASPAGEQALIALIEGVATDGLVVQAYVARWAGDDEPNSTLYETAADIFMHQRVAHGWASRYLRAVADHLWLGPEFSLTPEQRADLERVAEVKPSGNTLVIERRPGASLRDIEHCLEPMLPSKADAEEFGQRIHPPRRP